MASKELFENEIGSLTFIGVPLLLCGFSLILINFQRSKLYYINNQLKYRHQLCTKFLNFSLKEYVDGVIRKNKIIKASYYASLIPNPKVSVPARSALKLYKALQLKDHITYLYKINKNKYCHKVKRYHYLISPFHIYLNNFKRRTNQTAILRKNKWEKLLYSRGRKHFISKTNFNLKNTSINYQTSTFLGEVFLK